MTGWMPRLIWVFAGRTGLFVSFVMLWLVYLQPPKQGSAKKKLSKAEKDKLKQEEEERKALEEGWHLNHKKNKKKNKKKRSPKKVA